MQKLLIYKCRVAAGIISRIEGSFIGAFINPASFTHSHGIEYESKEVLGTLPSVGDFKRYVPEQIGFKLHFDGTGAVPEPVPVGSVLTVTQRINELKRIIFDFDGKTHRPNVVCIVWGSFSFYACLTNFDIEYTLFRPDGEPLRARVDLKFKGYQTRKEEALRANKSSPDLTHLVEVRAGDTLPLLCQRIYNDESYFPEVAKANHLTSFRYLKPGSRLVFPPLSDKRW